MDYTAIEGILIWRIAGLFELGPVCWLSFWRWKRSIVQRDYSRYPKPIFDHNLHLRPQKYTAEFWNNFLCNLFWTIDLPIFVSARGQIITFIAFIAYFAICRLIVNNNNNNNNKVIYCTTYSSFMAIWSRQVTMKGLETGREEEINYIYSSTTHLRYDNNTRENATFSDFVSYRIIQRRIMQK